MANEQKSYSTDEQEISFKNDDKALERFNDLSGITLKNLNFGLWWVQNSKFIKQLAFWSLMIIGLLGWLYTIGSYGYYLAVGMRSDNLMLEAMTKQSKEVHQYVVANAPSDIVIGDIQSVALNDQIDLVAQITNPNDRYYALLGYNVESGGTVIKSGESFVLPNETKNITVLGLKANEVSGDIQIKLASVAWRRVNNREISDWPTFRSEHINFPIEGATYIAANNSGLTENVNLGQIEFTITNATAYNYYELPLQIFLKSYNRVAGVTTTNLANFMSGEKRLVRVNLSGFSGEAEQIEIVPNLDITRKDIYTRFSGQAK